MNCPLFTLRNAAEALYLSVAGFEIAVPALAHQNSRLVGILDPVAVLLEGLAWTARGRTMSLRARSIEFGFRFGLHAVFTNEKRLCGAAYTIPHNAGFIKPPRT